MIMTSTAPASLAASKWRAIPDNSTLGFEVEAGGKTLRKRFLTFEAEIDFDPDAPGSGAINVLIDLASLTTGMRSPA